MSSINQTGAGIRLPNFCNLGVMLRVLVIANLFVLAAAALRAREMRDIGSHFLGAAALAEPVLIVSLLVLCAARRVLHSLRYPAAIALLLSLELLIAWGWTDFFSGLVPNQAPASPAHVSFFVIFVTGVTLVYFDLRARALSPAIAEARIQALQSRIRPHFLFNSINTVLSLIRTEPKRAERALEDLADLFRVLMADDRPLTPLSKEVEIARQYLAIEQLRLGERLRVTWHTEEMPREALVPALLLQPLVENAVYHGIEPLEGGGEITIDVRAFAGQLVLSLTNPFRAEGAQHAGSRMATANIRERLALHYDAEASMQVRASGGTYEVVIRIPLMTGKE